MGTIAHVRRPKRSVEALIAEYLAAYPAPSKLSMTLASRRDLETSVANVRTLLEEVEEVVAQSIRHGTGVETRRLMEALRVAERELEVAVGRAAEAAGLRAK